VPFIAELEEGERLLAFLSFTASSKSRPFHLAISDRAVFLLRIKIFAVTDPEYCERVPLNRVVEAAIKKLSPYWLWILALVMVVVGTVTTILMMIPILRGEGGEVSGYPPAVAVVGLVIPFLAKRRYGLLISMVNESFLWKPPLVVDKTSRDKVACLLSQAADALRQEGVKTRDEREPNIANH
jgi:hypothetical protein